MMVKRLILKANGNTFLYRGASTVLKAKSSVHAVVL